MYFDDWHGLWRVVAVGVPAYLLLVLLLVASGKRTLSKMNAFDLVITVAIGSTLSSILLSSDVALAEGLLALTLLISMQFVMTWTSVRFESFKHLVKAEPTLLFHQGRFLTESMHRQRVTEEEIRQAVRAQGMPSLDQVEAVVLETDGRFSVIQRTELAKPSALSNVAGLEVTPRS